MPKKLKKQQIIVRKKYNTGNSNKIFGLISQQNLNTALAVGAFALAAGIGYKVFFANSNGKQEEQQQQNQQSQTSIPQTQNSPQQQTPFVNPQQNNVSAEDVRTMIKNGGPVKVQQGSIADNIAQNVAALSTYQEREPVFSQNPPLIDTHPEPTSIVRDKPIVKTKEQVLAEGSPIARKQSTKKVPSYGDDYYNAISSFPNGFFLKNPAPKETSK